MWDLYQVEMEFTGNLCGSVPLAKELIRPWLESRMPNTKPDNARPIEEIEQEVLESIEGVEERTTLGFQHDSDGLLFVRSGTIKAHVKDCANQIKDVLKISALKSKVANKVYVVEDPVYILRKKPPPAGSGITEPIYMEVTEEDGEFERAVHVMTARGPRNALKRVRFITSPVLSFTLKVLQDKEVTEKVLRAIFEYGGLHGYGGERGMGEGRYKAVITRA